MTSPNLYDPSNEPLRHPVRQSNASYSSFHKNEIASQVKVVEEEVRRRWRWMTGGLGAIAAILGITSITCRAGPRPAAALLLPGRFTTESCTLGPGIADPGYDRAAATSPATALHIIVILSGAKNL